MNFKKNKKVKCSESSRKILIGGKIDWKIQNFSEVCMTRRGSIQSPNRLTQKKEFYSKKLKKSFTFHLAIVSKGESNEPQPNFTIHLVNDNHETLDIRLEYSLVGNHHSSSVAKTWELYPPQNSKGSEVSMSEAERFLVKKSLHIRCKFLVTTCTYDVGSENKEEEEEEEETFQQSMEKMFANPKFTNFQIICDDGQTFDCHKTILASKSDFFDEMFSSELSNSSSITIKDVTPQTVKKMLQYVYTNRFILDDGERDLAEMILVADKYKISELFDACQLVMSDEMKVEMSDKMKAEISDKMKLENVTSGLNVSDVKDVASNVDTTHLTKAEIILIAGKCQSVTGTQTPKELVEAKSELAKANPEVIDANLELNEANLGLIEVTPELVEADPEIIEANPEDVESNPEISDETKPEKKSSKLRKFKSFFRRS